MLLRRVFLRILHWAVPCSAKGLPVGLRLDNNHFAYTPIVATVTRKRATKLGRMAAALLAVFKAGAVVVSTRSPFVVCATKTRTTYSAWLLGLVVVHILA